VVCGEYEVTGVVKEEVWARQNRGFSSSVFNIYRGLYS
jgi:hypothetical protein